MTKYHLIFKSVVSFLMFIVNILKYIIGIFLINKISENKTQIDSNNKLKSKVF